MDGQGAYRGTVSSLQVEEAMRDNALDATAGELALETATLRPDQRLERALQELVRRGATGLPMVEEMGGCVIGWLSHADVLHAYARRLEASVAQVAEPGSSAAPAPGRSSRAIPAPRLHGYRLVDLTLSAVGRPIDPA